MTEKEYMNARDLERIESAKTILGNIDAESSNIIPKEEFSEIIRKLTKWQNELYGEINTQ